MNPTKVAANMIGGFLEDAQPFLDLLKIEGYFTKNMELTQKGRDVLQKHFAEKYKGVFDEKPDTTTKG